jgi:hypothetical protein
MEAKHTMSKKQLKQAHVLRKYNEGLLSRWETAEALRLSERQITRLSKGMKEKGKAALIHKNMGRKPSHAITAEEKERIRAIRREDIYNFSLASKKQKTALQPSEIKGCRALKFAISC